MCKDIRTLLKGSEITGVSLTGVQSEPLSLREDEAKAAAIGFIAWLCRKCGKKPEELVLAIGRDSRTSGPRLLDGLMDGFGLYGCRVYDCGKASEPAMFMTTVFPDFACDGAVVITAGTGSYNRNGFRLYTQEGRLGEEDMKSVLSYGADRDLQIEIMGEPTMEGKQTHRLGKLVFEPEKADVMTLYCRHLRNDIIERMSKGSRPLEGLKVAVDAGNGVGGFYAKDVLKPLGADISASQHLEPDGMFENHAPDPENSEALNAVSMAVLSGGADLGILFDAPASCFAVVDERGRRIHVEGHPTLLAADVIIEAAGKKSEE